jgi:hypothetical protein
MNYSVLRNGKKIGAVKKSKQFYILVGFKKSDEEFFSKIGCGEKGISPKDGEAYIEALKQKFVFSSIIAIKEENK